eukprot:Gb_36783 [translate_table: standard]
MQLDFFFGGSGIVRGELGGGKEEKNSSVFLHEEAWSVRRFGYWFDGGAVFGFCCVGPVDGDHWSILVSPCLPRSPRGCATLSSPYNPFRGLSWPVLPLCHVPCSTWWLSDLSRPSEAPTGLPRPPSIPTPLVKLPLHHGIGPVQPLRPLPPLIVGRGLPLSCDLCVPSEPSR